MVNDLLDLAKIEAGRISISPAWFEMVDLFAALRGMFKPLLTSEAVSLVFEEPVNFRGSTRTTKSSRRSPQLYLECSEIHCHRRSAGLRPRRSTSRGSVFLLPTPGIGIAPEYHAAVFEDFVQVDSPLQRKWREPGLGPVAQQENGDSARRRSRHDQRTWRGIDVFSHHSNSL